MRKIEYERLEMERDVNAHARAAILKGEGKYLGLAKILEVLNEKWDIDYIEEYLLLTYEIPIGKKLVQRQIIKRADDLFDEEYGCTFSELCDKGLKEIFGEVPKLISEEKILLFSEDVTILYDDIEKFAADLLGKEEAYDMFENFKEEHERAEYKKEMKAQKAAEKKAAKEKTKPKNANAEKKTSTAAPEKIKGM